MKTEIIYFKKVIFIPTTKNHNIPKISGKKRNQYKRKFDKKGWYNGKLMSCDRYEKQGNTLKIYYGKSNFYDFIISSLEKEKIFPLFAVNALIEVEDCIILIKRGPEVFSYPGWLDFPAGLIPFKESLKSRLINRIEYDTKIKEKDISIREIIKKLIILENSCLNFFYNVKYLKSKKTLENFLKKNFNNDSPLLIKKSEIHLFLNQMVFPKILKEEYCNKL